MKTILLFLAIFFSCFQNYAQPLGITNNAACDINVTMYASMTVPPCSGYCANFVSNVFTVSSGTTVSWCDPFDFQTGTSGSGCCNCPVGWSSTPGCTIPSFGALPGNFQWDQIVWTYASGCSSTCTPDYTGTGVMGNQCLIFSTCPFPVLAGVTWGDFLCHMPYGTWTPSCVSGGAALVITIY